MLFPSQVFLFIFLPAVLLTYYLSGRRLRNAVLLVFSYIFYTCYVLALLMGRGGKRGGGAGGGGGKNRCLFLAASIFINLSVLAYFKYANFFVGEINRALEQFGASGLGWTEVVLPIGISFFTFQKITYVTDVYRGTRLPNRNFVDYALYVALFPQLIAGPIVRYHEISEQIKSRAESIEGFSLGVMRFSWGLGKKVLLANACAEVADAVFAMGPGALGTQAAWLGVFAYTLQIYFDFSAYSDMAIGLGHMFGFTLPENFRRPYSAESITDFWRRWHITLSNFFRDYLYIPLGGNRSGDLRTYFNLFVVFILCGMWHGASWTFLVWGLFHGGLLAVERFAGLRHVAGGLRVVPRRVLTLLLVMVGWVFFRSEGLAQAVDFLSVMFQPAMKPFPLDLHLALNNRNIFFMAVASIVVLLPGDFSGFRLMELKRGPILSSAQVVGLAVILVYAVALIVSGSYNPFIYFQF
jgi:alginate O-acetyltransferase complex protein AlgI